ncbi:tyrosine-type recombinase/integrase [Nitrospina gracilis]|uniref:tyrosine-type recombinase/integrase n=1 Tax=Nitrospina gracilis TaxID=35801 RepID=UPI001EFFE162|nr:tyrosine-type recombinase/integrase [Nitrospina gracilis]MCF8721614.1 site-specific recombinase XerD [Nitrospina gracilis Nb-211]
MERIRFRDGNVYLYKRENSRRWQARIKLKNGKWKRISTKQANLKDASEIACNLHDEYRVLQKHNVVLESRRFVDAARISIKEMEQELQAGYGKKSYLDYIQAINRYFIPYFGNTLIANIDFTAIKKFDLWRNEQVKRRLKHSTLNNHNSALKRVFNVAVDRGWINAYQVPELRNKGERSQRRPNFSWDEIKKLCRFMREWAKEGRTEKSNMMRELLQDYVLILIQTGMRHGTETASLKWKHIEEFSHNGTAFLRFWVNGKTGKRELIAKHNVRRYLKRIKKRFGKVSGEENVFRLSNGESTKCLDGTFNILMKESGLMFDRHGNRRTLYSLRHTYATFQILKGIDLHRLARNMGTSIGMLEAHYSHLTPTMAAKDLAGR